ncbi:MAG: ATP-binding protein [Chlamydiota bacterium]|nr:ATP-binding protein [Chlamydiota bacterium]
MKEKEEREWQALRQEWRKIYRWVIDWVGGEDGAEHLHLLLAIEEAVVNVMEHGYGWGGQTFSLSCDSWEDKGILFQVIDDAPPFDPTQGKGLREEGAGIHLMMALVDEVHYEHSGGFNRLTLKKRLDPRR